MKKKPAKSTAKPAQRLRGFKGGDPRAIGRLGGLKKGANARAPSEHSFLLGRLLATPGALAACQKAGVSPLRYIVRHADQNWGGLSEAERKSNDETLTSGRRILSSYLLPNCTKVLVITEPWNDVGIRAATTLLLPEEC